VNFEPSAPLLNLALALGLTPLSLAALYALNRITWRWVVQPLSWAFFGDRRRTIWYHLALFPGTVIHECSHLLACWVSLVPVIEFRPFSLDPNRPPGWVRHQRTDPIRSNLIGLAPFVGGSLALLVAIRVAFPTYAADWLQRPSASVPGDLPSLVGHAGQLVWGLMLHADYLDWRTWLFLYLAFSIGLQIAPSPADLQALPGGLLLVIGAIGGCYLVGLALHIDWASLPAVADGLVFLAGLLMALNRIFAYSAALILLSLIIFVPLAGLLARLRG